MYALAVIYYRCLDAQLVNTRLDALAYHQELALLVVHVLLDNIDWDALERLVARVLPVIRVLRVSIDLHVKKQIQALAPPAWLIAHMVFTLKGVPVHRMQSVKTVMIAK